MQAGARLRHVAGAIGGARGKRGMNRLAKASEGA
jgi:hypothetical protein